MRIAIVGAGLAGLACAHELERLGFAPNIFEKGDQLGRRSMVVEVMSQFMHMHPRQDIFAHLQEELALPLNPTNHVQRLVMHSHSRQATLTGHLAYTTVRGPDERSLEYQLARHVRSPIHFHQTPDITQLQREYDWVVVATGTPEVAQQFGQWHTNMTWSIRGALVKGEFNPAQLDLFMKTRYAGTGYAMIVPMDERTASVGVAVPGYISRELEQCWETFRIEQGHRWESELASTRFENLQCGTPDSRVVGNVLLIGAAGGFVDCLALSGQCPSLASGVYAARQIALGDRTLKRFFRRWQVYSDQLLRLRRYVNAWTDKEMDRLVQLAGPGVSHLLANSPWNLLGPSAVLVDALRLPEDHSPKVGPE